MLLRFGELPLLVARRQPLRGGQQPDLVEMHRLGRRGIELAVLDSRSCRHPLELPCMDDRAVAHAVPVLQGPFQDIGDDLHVPMAVHAEALARLYPVLVHDPQGSKTHVGRVVVGVERERVPCVEPVVLGMATVGRFSQFDHDVAPSQRSAFCYNSTHSEKEGAMAGRVCPWWLAWFSINNPLRRLVHDPQKIVGPYVQPGMTVLDVGCGVGWFSIPMAAMVGDQGQVIAVDLQPQMLAMLRRRAEKAGVAVRIQFHQCKQDRLGVDAQADFALTFAMVHEVPDQRRLLGEIHACLKPDGKLLLAEPPLHVSRKTFVDEVASAEAMGFRVAARPLVRWSQAVLLKKAIT